MVYGSVKTTLALHLPDPAGLCARSERASAKLRAKAAKDADLVSLESHPEFVDWLASLPK